MDHGEEDNEQLRIESAVSYGGQDLAQEDESGRPDIGDYDEEEEEDDLERADYNNF